MKKLLTITLMLVLTFTVFAAVKTKYEVKKDDCIGCKLCVSACPVDAIKMVDGKAVIDKEKCIGCGICVNKCPVNAIVKADLKKEASDKITAAAAETKVITADKLQSAKTLKPKAKALQKETKKHAKGAEKHMKAQDAHKTQHTPCGTHPCANNKETTEKQVHKTETKVENPKDKIIYSVNTKDCIGCKICVKKCPVGAIEMKKGKAVIDQEKCIDCGICEQACPVKVIEKKEK